MGLLITCQRLLVGILAVFFATCCIGDTNLLFGNDLQKNLDFIKYCNNSISPEYAFQISRTITEQLSTFQTKSDEVATLRTKLFNKYRSPEATIKTPEEFMLLLMLIPATTNDIVLFHELLSTAYRSQQNGQYGTDWGNAFFEYIDENAVYEISLDSYKVVCSLAEAIYEEKEPEKAAFWRAKRLFLLANATEEDISHENRDSTQMNSPILLFVLLVVSIIAFAVFNNPNTLELQRSQKSIPATKILPTRLRKYAMTLWLLITQIVFFVVYLSEQLATTDSNHSALFLALVIATIILIWLYYRMAFMLPSIISASVSIFNADENWITSLRKNYYSTKTQVCVSGIWGIIVATTITPYLFENPCWQEPVAWIFFFYINAWTGAFSHMLFIICFYILMLNKYKPTGILFHEVKYTVYGKLVLMVGITLILYISLCLGVFRIYDIRQLNMWYSVYLLTSVSSVCLFVFGIPLFLHLTIKKYISDLIDKAEPPAPVDQDTNNQPWEEIFEIKSKHSHCINELKSIKSWPFNSLAVSQFLTVIMVPVLMIIYDLLTNTDSIVYNFSKFQKLQFWM